MMKMWMESENRKMKQNDLELIGELITKINTFIADKTLSGELMVNSDKVEEFQTILVYISKIQNVAIYQKMMEQIKLLEKQVEVYTSVLSPKDFKEEDFNRLTITYFLMLKKDIDKVLKIDNDFIYLIMNAMRGVPYLKYQECIDKFTYPKLMELMVIEGPTETARIILNTLSDTIKNNEKEYCLENLDQDMEQFIKIDVYSRIKPDMTGDYEQDLKLLLQSDQSYNLKNIRNAKKVNTKIYMGYEKKFTGLTVYDQMDIMTIQKYIETTNYIVEKNTV